MVNQVVLVGRVAKITEIGNDATIRIAVPRNYKNDNGDYDIDFINCQLYNSVAKSTLQYCNTGDMVGIKGKLKNIADKIILYAEKVTFLTSRNIEEE